MKTPDRGIIGATAIPHPQSRLASAATPAREGAARLTVLDGWRAASILLVLVGHLLPLGPGWLALNSTIAATGMVLFFILSGFLITRFLSNDTDLRVFIIRRLFRIIPLAWLVMIILLIANRSPAEIWAANLFFYANLVPGGLVDGGGHLWSLCVEMHFYVGIALFVAVFGRRALVVLPAMALAITALRVATHSYTDIVTWYRCDEILAGGILALCYSGRYGEGVQRLLAWLNPYWLLPLLVLSAHPASGPLNYLRPYIAAATIGATLFAGPPLLARMFETRIAAYIATISYALYILHMSLAETWLGSGEKLVKYAKRPLLIAVTFMLAHLSTFRFEQPCIAFAKRLTKGKAIHTPA